MPPCPTSAVRKRVHTRVSSADAQPAQMDSETWRARRKPETSAYLVDPQQARKAATASSRDMPLMRSIVRSDMGQLQRRYHGFFHVNFFATFSSFPCPLSPAAGGSCVVPPGGASFLR